MKKHRFSWLKKLIVPLGVIVTLWLLSVHVVAGFAFIIGLTIGSVGDKLKLWDN